MTDQPTAATYWTATAPITWELIAGNKRAILTKMPEKKWRIVIRYARAKLKANIAANDLKTQLEAARWGAERLGLPPNIHSFEAWSDTPPARRPDHARRAS